MKLTISLLIVIEIITLELEYFVVKSFYNHTYSLIEGASFIFDDKKVTDNVYR